jgi:hypothetical protein
MGNTFTVSNIDAAKYAILLKKLEEEMSSGLTVSADGYSGEGSGDHVEIKWVYNPTGSDIEITVEKKPFIVSESTVESDVENKITAWLNG